MPGKTFSNEQKTGIVIAIIGALSAIGVAIATHRSSTPNATAIPTPAVTQPLVLLAPTTVPIPTKVSLDEAQVSVAIERPTTPSAGVNITVYGSSGAPYVWPDTPARNLQRATFGATTYLIHILEVHIPEVDSEQPTATLTVSKKRE